MIHMLCIVFLALLTSCSDQGVSPSMPKWLVDRGLAGKATWDETTGTLHIKESVVWGGDDDVESFYFMPPTEVTTILIGANVTVTGGFRCTHGLTIRGEDRSTSVIFGTNTVAWARGPNKADDSPDCNKTTGDDRAADCLKWSYGAISALILPLGDTLRISSLTLRNARTYNITSTIFPIRVDNVLMIERRTEESRSNCDGFGAGSGSAITNSTIDVTDDAIKLYRGMTVRNVTIIKRRNGAPFQLGWHSEPTSSHSIENVIVRGADPEALYNCGLFSWKSPTASTKRTIQIDGLKTEGLQNAKLWNGTGWVPHPLFELRSPNAEFKLSARNVDMKSAAATLPSSVGNFTLDVCGSNAVVNTYQCGDIQAIVGDD